MHFRPLLRVLSLACCATLCSCSDADKPPAFEQPGNALDLADSALAAGHPITATAGYRYALDQGDSSMQADALVGLVRVYAEQGSEPLALLALERLIKDFPAQLTFATGTRLLQASNDAKMIALGNAALLFLHQSYPQQREQLLAPFQEIIATASEVSASEDTLSQMGYVGGQVDLAQDTANLLLDLEDYVGLLQQAAEMEREMSEMMQRPLSTEDLEDLQQGYMNE